MPRLSLHLMRRDQSYGIVPLRKSVGEWEVCLVQLHQGHWGFPKGHAEPHELPKESAERELTEETSLVVLRYLTEETFEEHYMFRTQGVLVNKTVTYFLAEVVGECHIQAEELADARWVSLKEAQKVLTFKESKNLLNKVIAFLY